MTQKKLKLGILVSGNGTNLQSIIDACEKGQIAAEVSVVICNNPTAYALERAKKHKLPAFVVSLKNGEEEILKILEQHSVNLVCLAGFMKILSPSFLKKYPQRIINIHPSLLPAFPGLNAQAQAFKAKVKTTGATVHFVDEGCDTGPIILQKSVTVQENDTLETLTERILAVEHEIYPEAIDLIAHNFPSLEGRGLRGG